MLRVSPYTVGWIDTSIHDFLADMDDPPASMAYALITCLDSSFDIAGLVGKNSRLATLKKEGTIVGKGLLLKTRRLLALDRSARLFFGFDEVWFFSHSLVSPKPKNLVITGPERISESMLKPLTSWLQSNGAYLGLGDGTGMNFCAKLRGVARRIVESVTESNLKGFETGRAIA
ncbi:MAG: hypothetical protein ACR2FY_23210 [Pirellulaceae bacterium]